MLPSSSSPSLLLSSPYSYPGPITHLIFSAVLKNLLLHDFTSTFVSERKSKPWCHILAVQALVRMRQDVYWTWLHSQVSAQSELHSKIMPSKMKKEKENVVYIKIKTLPLNVTYCVVVEITFSWTFLLNFFVRLNLFNWLLLIIWWCINSTYLFHLCITLPQNFRQFFYNKGIQHSYSRVFTIKLFKLLINFNPLLNSVINLFS